MVVKDAAGRILKEGDDIMYVSRCGYRSRPYLRKGILLRIEKGFDVLIRVEDYDQDWGKKVVRLYSWHWLGRGVQYNNIVKIQ